MKPLLLVDVIFMNPRNSLRGLVVETYDRDHQRDCFAEHRDKKTPLSTPDELSRYKLIKVSSRPAMYGNSMITLGTKQMNAIFTKVILQVHGGPERLDIGQSAGADVFQPQIITRVFLSKDSIKAAKAYRGLQSAEPLPPLARLRCVFSHFSHVSTYFPARAGHAGGPLPVTLFTLETFELFAKVASAMMANPSTAVLTREDVENLSQKTKLHQKIRSSLLEVFQKDVKLSITTSIELNQVLLEAANDLRADVKRANDARFKICQ